MVSTRTWDPQIHVRQAKGWYLRDGMDVSSAGVTRCLTTVRKQRWFWWASYVRAAGASEPCAEDQEAIPGGSDSGATVVTGSARRQHCSQHACCTCTCMPHACVDELTLWLALGIGGTVISFCVGGFLPHIPVPLCFLVERRWRRRVFLSRRASCGVPLWVYDVSCLSPVWTIRST